MLESGDEILAVLDPGLEEDLKNFLGPDEPTGWLAPGPAMADREAE